MKTTKRKIPLQQNNKHSLNYDQEEDNFDTYRPSEQPHDSQYAKMLMN